MIKPIVLGLSVSVLLSACGGRAANPVMISQFGDERKSCDALILEMGQIESSIQTLLPKTEKTGKNVALGVTGAFFLVPLFFMDLTQAEQIEVDAFRQRYNRLAIIATEKGCGDIKQVPPVEANEPSKNESKKN